MNARRLPLRQLDPGATSPVDGIDPYRSAERRHPRVRPLAGPRPHLLRISSATPTSRSTTGSARPDVLPDARRRQGHGDVRDHRQRGETTERNACSARRHPRASARSIRPARDPQACAWTCPTTAAAAARARRPSTAGAPVLLDRRWRRDGPSAAATPATSPLAGTSSSTRRSRPSLAQVRAGGNVQLLFRGAVTGRETVSRQWPGTRRSRRNVPSRCTSAVALAPPGPDRLDAAARDRRARDLRTRTSPAIPPGKRHGERSRIARPSTAVTLVG